MAVRRGIKNKKYISLWSIHCTSTTATLCYYIVYDIVTNHRRESYSSTTSTGPLSKVYCTTVVLTYSVEDHVQAVIDVGHPVPETEEVKAVLDVTLVYLAEHLVTLEPTEAAYPSVLSIG